MKIIEVNSTMNVGGIETFLMNIVRNIDLNKYEFTFLTYRDYKYDYEDELNSLGCKILRITHPKNIKLFRTFKHIRNLYNAIKEEKADVIHTHTYFDSAVVLYAAKKAGVKTRIVHSHTSWALDEKNILKKIKHSICRIMINKYSTNKLACSELAGRALYGNKNFTIIPNGIDFNKFYFNNDIRKEKRKELNIKDNEIVIGHVGRIDVPKNHTFLLKIFKEVLKVNDNYKLILVGEGPLYNKIKEEASDLKDKVLFLGNRSDVNLLLNAFDIFVFPSLYEGLPISLVEAQSNGLFVLASSNISKEIKLSKALEFYSIDESSKSWAEKIINAKKERIDTKDELLKSDYSIYTTIEKLTKIFNK